MMQGLWLSFLESTARLALERLVLPVLGHEDVARAADIRRRAQAEADAIERQRFGRNE